MSTYFYFNEPVTRQELESYGVNFLDGEIERNGEKHPYTWIISTPEKQEGTLYLHPNFLDDEKIYGWTRYGMNNSGFLETILKKNFIEYADEYSVSDYAGNIDFEGIAKQLGYDVPDKDSDEYDEFMEEFNIGFYEGDFCSVEFYFSKDKRKYLKDLIESEQFRQEVATYLEKQGYLIESEK